ncbi:trihelix transcription factor PTL-like [Gastrolobium bilobum]|uniref:trihelix transcription factor PTL-like n=1 Tax=Gastrolobium bilobum TaxID=150636 RepID=UPI002AB2CE01|nr:trihelix transcription factor PTL-like [Gastrolobium bilobum]
MGEPYGLPEDLRRLISARNHFNINTSLPESLCSVHHGLNVAAAAAPPPPPNSYDPIMVGDVFFPRGFTHFAHHDYLSSVNPTTNTTTTTTTTTNTTTAAVDAATALDYATAPFCGIQAAEKGWLGFDSGNNRWPRQETLSLLEIRSRLDSKFRENNQKAPLWNEISRIMAEEFGYQRSGKKCKEKFENLYKYYKKTKEGKASRQDGKHYRFFRQLEAICGEATAHASTSNKTHHAANTSGIQTPSFKINQDNGDFNNLKCSESLSFSNSSEFETSSSENNDEDLSAIAYMMKQSRGKQKGLDQQRESHRRLRKSWRAKVEEIVDSHMRKIIETQDAWMERMLSVVEQREQEMVSKEEERKKKESMRFDQEVHELWAKEKAWVEARDAALIDIVRKHIGIELETLPLDEAMVEEQPNKNKGHANNDANEYPSEAVDHSSSRWTEMEISNLIQLRTGFEHRFRENGYLENGLWDEIAAKLACLGFDRSATECKQIWDEISISLRRTVDSGAKTRPWCLGLKLRDDDDL